MAESALRLAEVYSRETVSELFQPDVVLPSQFLGITDPGINGGERRLMAAILSDGVEAYIAQASGVDRFGAKSDAEQWVESRDTGYIFSFDNVCTCLGIDPEYLRLGLFRYIEAIKLRRNVGSSSQEAWRKIRRPRK